MISKLKSVIAFLFVMCVTSVSFAQITSDFDKSIDFSKYKTYAFAGWQKDSDKKLNDFDKKRILDALKNELELRGLTFVTENPDATISIFVMVVKKTNTTAYTDYVGGLGYYGWGTGFGSTRTTYSHYDYQEGTLVVDMFDESSKNLVWQGTLQTEVQENPEKREKTIPKKIRKLMRKFPIPYKKIK